MYLSTQQVTATTAVQTKTAFASVPKATGVMLQAETANIRYTMDNTTAPVASGVGMLLVPVDGPQYFLIEDFNRIQFIRDTGTAKLNAHFVAGRDI